MGMGLWQQCFLDKEDQMLLKLRERMASEEKGFTLIELLVVMLIIGILAAIAIPTFFNQKQKASDSSAKEMAHSAQVAMETYATDNDGKYTGATVALLQAIEPTISTGGNAVTIVGTPDNTSYDLRVTNSATSHTFDIVKTATTLTFPCATAGQGGCPAGGGGWGG
jgi:type IV pilus assembly protein PilA